MAQIDFTEKDKEILITSLTIYKEKVSKIMKATGELKAGGQDIKDHFLQTERLIDKIVQN